MPILQHFRNEYLNYIPIKIKCKNENFPLVKLNLFLKDFFEVIIVT